MTLVAEARRVLDRVEATTPGDRNLIEAQRQHLEEALAPFDSALQGLAARYHPEMKVPAPCDPHPFEGGASWPWINFLRCYDFCSACRAEAERALDLLLFAAEQNLPREVFLSPEICAARIRAGALREQEWRRRRAADNPGGRIRTTTDRFARSHSIGPGDRPAHADDFSWIRAGDGSRYDFTTSQQRDVMRVLYSNWERGGDGASMTPGAIIEAINLPIRRLRVERTFAGSPAFETILRRSEGAEVRWALYLTQEAHE